MPSLIVSSSWPAGCRFSVKRAGNVFLGFNAKPATATVPFLSPIIAPGARLLGPMLARLAESPVSATLAGGQQASSRFILQP